MDEFKVKIGKVRNVVSDQNGIAAELAGIQDELYRVRNSLRFKIAQRERIDRRLTQQGEALGQEKRKMGSLAFALSDIADLYERTESELCGMDAERNKTDNPAQNPLLWFIEGVVNPHIFDILGPGGQCIWDATKFFSDSLNFGKNDSADSSDGGLVTDNAQSLVDRLLDKGKEKYDKIKEFEDKVSDWSDSKKKNWDKVKGEYDFQTGTFTKVDMNDESAVKKFDENLEKTKMDTDVTLASIGGAVSNAVWTKEGIAGDSEGTHASFKVSALEAEAHAEAYMGLCQTDPETGEKSFKPGFGASAGASFCAFTAEEEAQLGSDMLGAYVKSTQTVGKVGAEAEATLGLYDSEGKLNPSAYAGVSAEAIAGEITGTVGGKVLGTDVGVSGSLNYGIGAHATAGYKDGKLSLDVGATLGVGASVKLEIDVSGTVDAVCDGAKAAWDGVKGWFK